MALAMTQGCTLPVGALWTEDSGVEVGGNVPAIASCGVFKKGDKIVVCHQTGNRLILTLSVHMIGINKPCREKAKGDFFEEGLWHAGEQGNSHFFRECLGNSISAPLPGTALSWGAIWPQIAREKIMAAMLILANGQ